ncbi:MAG: T9SS type A sorting domain-containing protein [Candidatus Marinimicrobia bacterium]|nr:T9SS type A sorting domain-containing protein [Candidatus Neomarinimicrobiota bacterium]
MKRVVALLLIASVALFAAVAPQSDLKVNAGNPQPKLIQAEIQVAPLQIEENHKRTFDTNNAYAPAIAVDTNVVTLVYFEDFESGAPGWVQFDGTAPDPLGAWHLDDWTTGDSLWWCGDYASDGYLSSWYVALETPEVILAGADSILSFYMELHSEGPGGEPTGYDGWDGGHVQITNDDGETWTTLTPTGVPYNCTSLYSFGYVFNMGPGIPGWGGMQSGDVEVNLIEYLDDTVKVRFVFSSDASYDVTDNAALLGMMIDSIDVAGNATYNGAATDGLVSYAVNAASGAFWTVENRTDSLPSVTHVARNYIVGDTTYAPLLEDYFVSPSIILPDEPATLIYCNFEFLADFIDETGDFPNVDYWRLEVSPDDGASWNAISNPTGNPALPNYVYSHNITTWYDFQYAYGTSCDLTALAGNTVKFRFYFHSDDDAPAGGGLMVDDFVVYTQPDLPVPTSVATAMNAEDNVVITWDDMNGTYQLPKSFMAMTPDPVDGSIYYGPGYTFFGNDSTTGFGVGMEYSTNGKDITFTSLDYAIYNINPYEDSISVAIFGLDSIVNLLHWTDNFVPDTVHTIVSLDISSEDVSWNGTFRVLVFWESSPFYPTFYMESGSGLKLYKPGVGFYSAGYMTPIGASGYGEVTYSGLEYNVYRRVNTETTLALVASNVSANTVIDDTADPLVEYEYYVVTIQDDFEGQLSVGSSIFVTPSDVEEIAHDDGGIDDYLELGMDTIVVVKITPSTYPAKLEALRFFGAWGGDVYKIKVYEDDGGMPSDSWLLIEPPVTCITGWNTFTFVDPLTSTGSGIVLEEGSIWIGVKGATPGAYPAWLGMDMGSVSGLTTVQVPGGGWGSIVPLKRGNPMIRGYFDIDISLDATEEIVPATYALAQNYPNPFNPVTTIHFELKESGTTTLEIFDITGRHVRTLVNSEMQAGSYDLRFDASALSSGVYFYRMTSGDFTSIKKMSLVK